MSQLVYNCIRNKYVFASGRERNKNMPSAAIKIDQEIKRRKEDRNILQDKLDLEEIERRIVAAQDGRSKILTKEEADALFEELKLNG